MSELDKKEKPKKKKSKDQGLAVPDSERKSSLTPPDETRRASDASEGEPLSRKPSTTGLEKESKSRKSSTVEGSEPKSRKTSSTNGTEPKSRKSSQAAPKQEEEAQPQEEAEEEEEDGEMPIMPEPPKTWDPDHVPFQAIAEAEATIVDKPVEYFQAPPETTKNDLHLLQELDHRRLAEMMEAFSMFDFDGDGVLSLYDLKRTYASLGQPEIDEEELERMLSEALNPLDFDAFVVLMGCKTLELDAEDVFRDALAQWDYGTEGLISEQRLFHDLQTFGEKFTKEEATAALEDAPIIVKKNNKEKMIDYLKFSSDLCGLRKRMKDYKPTKN